MWQLAKATVDARTERWQILAESGQALSLMQVIGQWGSDANFRTFWIERIREVPFDAYCWECPPVTVETSSRPFECVFISSPSLARMPPDPEPFAEYFRPNLEVVTFESLGKDAMLIAPCPEGQGSNFSHLASFVATASESRQSALWLATAKALESRIADRPIWLSTAGGGVAWLHVRLDTTPKYYRHAAYRHAGVKAISSFDRGA